MYALTPGLVRLVSLSEGEDLYLIPYNGHTVGSVRGMGCSSYVPINVEFEKGHILSGKSLHTALKALRQVGKSELKRQNNINGFSVQGAVYSAYWETKPFPTPTFTIPTATEHAWAAYLPTLALTDEGVDKLRGSLPIVITPTHICASSEYVAVSIDHGGDLPGNRVFCAKSLTKLAKGIYGIFDGGEHLWVYGKNDEVRRIELSVGTAPIYYAAQLPHVGVGGELQLKEVKSWFKQATKVKGYQPVKVFTAGGGLKLLAPGAGMLHVCDTKGESVNAQFFDARVILSVLKVWSSATITITASISTGGPLCFSDGPAVVSIEPIMEYPKC